MRRLLAIAAAAVGAALIAAAPSAALATGTPSPSPSVSSTASSASPTPTPTLTPTATSSGRPTATPTAPASPTATPTPTVTKKPKPKPKPAKHKPVHHAGTTVIGPRMYIPGTGNSDYTTRSTVTVNQTTDLTNQMVQVSWTGFSPSSQATYDPTSTDYPVMVAECKGLNPTNPTQCYGATNGGVPASFSQYGPTNTSYSTTEGNGTGTTDIQLFTSVQNQYLNCGQNSPCSLVVVPSQGGDSFDFPTPHCSNHTEDTDAADTGQYAFTTITSAPSTANGYCSWIKRIVIPLHFAPTPNGCPLRQADFTAGGSPMLAVAMQQWQTGLCFGANSVELQYNGSLNESEARSYFAEGTDDVAFTTLPLSGPTKYPYTYAPVAVSATSVGYWVDNANTGQPITTIKLDARLLTKLLTTSYAYTNDACPNGGGGGFGCDNGVDGNPLNIYADPEFRQLNPPSIWQNAAQPTGYEIPQVLSGDSDMTWVTTSWLAADQDSSGFLAGQFDPWGMHVNTSYLGLKYPITGFLPSDPYLPVSSQYAPVYPLSTLASDMALNQPSGTSDVRTEGTGNYDALSPQTPGNRDLWSLIDEADAARFLIPAAAIENAAGKFVQPTDTAMAAAVKDMTVNPDGITESMNYAKKDPAAYPLTMVIYAAVPIGGISPAKATAIARFLDFVADQGQQPGTAPGELPSGYLPLPQALRNQTLKGATEVLDQVGDPKPKSSTFASPEATPSASRTKSPSPTSSASASATAHSIVVAFSQPDTTGMSWLVLALLIAGAVLLITGPAALALGSPGARAAISDLTGRLRRAGVQVANIRRRNP
jgi:hypothetical protein